MLVTNAAIYPCPNCYNLTKFGLLKTEPYLCRIMSIGFKFCKFNCVIVFIGQVNINLQRIVQFSVIFLCKGFYQMNYCFHMNKDGVCQGLKM